MEIGSSSGMMRIRYDENKVSAQVRVGTVYESWHQTV